ncbi:MAG: DUF6519 domain-containing protein, partial [Terracidiphilus sp.]
MASDRARISYDKSRNYRSVVAQQGRVTLEADVNEAAWIAGDALRLETIDIVGPVGTPDNGYQVSVSSSGTEFVVGEGTLYLGGWRMELDHAVQLNNQPDWQNQPAPSPLTATTTDVVALLAIEQSVTAVEDQALREVALGGPDTAARMRLMQHFVEVPVSATSCLGAAKQVAGVLAENGLSVNSKTLELQFDASLRVSFNPPPQPVDPCCPPVQGGYLGADNQLLRVTVTAYDPNTKQGTLLWGWNNASFLYRAALVDAGASPQILTLSPSPIDTEHTPQPNQAIEVLRTQCVLGDATATDRNYVAALQGQVMTLGSGSVFANNQLTLPATLDSDYSSDKHPLFVRLWQAQVPFTEGQKTPLDSVSGVAVTIHMKKMPAAPFDARPYWHFAVRPNTPQEIYPQRYLEGDQLPDGPRQWLCDLAVVQTVQGQSVPSGATSPPTLTVLENCVPSFEPLTSQESCGCCELVLNSSDKEWQLKLQTVLNDSSFSAINVCFQPGRFEVTGKIVFTQAAVKIRGAGFGTVLLGGSLEAVMEFDKCGAVTLTDFSVAAGTAGYSPKFGTQNLQGAVTLRDCRQVNIERMAMRCVDADFRMASCLYVINTAQTGADAPPPTNNLRILNCEFVVGHCQVGVLLVNANIARVEGNWVYTPDSLRNINSSNITQYPYTMARMEKLVLHGLNMVDTAAAAKKAARKAARKQAKIALKPVAKKKKVDVAPTTQTPEAPAETAQGTPAGEGVKVESELVAAPGVDVERGTASQAGPAAAAPKINARASSRSKAKADPAATAPKLDLGLAGRSRITATLGTIVVQFQSDSRLTNAWTNAITASNLGPGSTLRQVHDTVRGIAKAAILGKSTEKALNDYVNLLFPSLYSISSQGIVVAGQYANDIRIQ